MLSWRAISSHAPVGLNKSRPETVRNSNTIWILTKPLPGLDQRSSVSRQSPRLWSSVVGSIQPTSSKNLPSKTPEPHAGFGVVSHTKRATNDTTPVPRKLHSNTCWCQNNPFGVDLSVPIDWAMPVDYEFDDDQDDQTPPSIQVKSHRTSNAANTSSCSVQMKLTITQCKRFDH